MTYEAWRISYQSSEQAARAAYAECARLQAKIEQMERQEPIKYECRRKPRNDLTWGLWKQCFKSDIARWGSKTSYEDEYFNYEVRALYALPGAQPAPSVPDVIWFPVPDKHPTFDPVDLQLADGSVLCGCVPQSDGDYWWEGPSGEVFIDPRYAPVTHWRLSAAQEAKP